MTNIELVNGKVSEARFKIIAGGIEHRSDALLWTAFVGLILAFGGFPTYTAQASSEEPRTISCTQPVPEFRLVPMSKGGRQWNPTSDQITKLCGCIWAKFPAGGWERETSRKIRVGEAPGWRREAFHKRLKQALHQCGI
ncbi:hypothetical protein [Mesorhizobium sp. M7A.F.Ca.MR.148.00.0.0]|uniref:hypothetical protein n=1 Tax=Mesorhizobium sp. M7A.F.Ca.MR.148.00.0.0 TaxID=2496775 RepID=UPI000FCB2151|nr:hypothetical protein [Mesorhizobium sp. M7A.F.Ca.MR.148.00.0.0]RUV33155.1 hypothetical protein EOB49_31910 [Mesorhizobium sp. M7A.F.Ca.MR.148.00.0.0]